MAQAPRTPAEDPRVRVTSAPDLGTQPARGPTAPLPPLDNSQAAVEATVTVQAPGAAPVTVTIEGAKDDEPTGKVNIRTIAKGTLNSLGITAVGTEAEIDIALFSAQWMEPKTATDRRKLEAAGKLDR